MVDAYLPAVQSGQVVDKEVEPLALPMLQELHAVDPSKRENFPAAQATQELEREAATEVLAVPAAQRVQAELPVPEA